MLYRSIIYMHVDVVVCSAQLSTLCVQSLNKKRKVFFEDIQQYNNKRV
jgi:hypothetical protein